MNVERILKLAEVLESDVAEAHFDMGLVFRATDDKSDYSAPIGEAINACGATACMAGWVHALFAPSTPAYDATMWEAALLLDMPYKSSVSGADAKHLFLPNQAPGTEAWVAKDVYLATPKEAAKVLRHLAATGEIDWSKGLEQ